MKYVSAFVSAFYVRTYDTSILFYYFLLSVSCFFLTYVPHLFYSLSRLAARLDFSLDEFCFANCLPTNSRIYEHHTFLSPPNCLRMLAPSYLLTFVPSYLLSQRLIYIYERTRTYLLSPLLSFFFTLPLWCTCLCPRHYCVTFSRDRLRATRSLPGASSSTTASSRRLPPPPTCRPGSPRLHGSLLRTLTFPMTMM